MIMEYKRVKDTEESKFRRENPLSKQREFVNKYLSDNQDLFEQAMFSVFEHDKKSFAKLYIEMQKSALPKEQGVSVNIGLSKDMENLIMLGRAGGDPKTLPSEPVDEPHFEDMPLLPE